MTPQHISYRDAQTFNLQYFYIIGGTGKKREGRKRSKGKERKVGRNCMTPQHISYRDAQTFNLQHLYIIGGTQKNREERKGRYERSV